MSARGFRRGILRTDFTSLHTFDLSVSRQVYVTRSNEWIIS